MSIYKINSTSNQILADQGFMDQYHAGDYTYIGEESAPIVKPSLTHLEFVNRFTDAELGAIYLAAKTVVAVEVWLDKFKMSQYVDTTDPRTVAGVQALEGAGLLSSGRAAEILA